MHRMLCLILALIGAAHCFPSVKVLGGTEVTPHSLPWVVNIRAATTHQIICTGVIYNEEYILTVASCVTTVLPQTLEVVVGEHDISQEDGAELRVNILEVLPHERYQEFTHFDDIALLHLETPLVWTDAIQPAPKPAVEDEEPTASACTLAGWGMSVEGESNSEVLLGADVVLLEDNDCRREYFGVALLGDNMICADSTAGKVPCGNGDTGSPLMCGSDNEVVGLFSFSENCTEYPPVFTQLSHFLRWIENTIEEHQATTEAPEQTTEPIEISTFEPSSVAYYY